MFHPGMHGTTFGGGPLACAVALAVLDDHQAKQKLLAHVKELGKYFTACCAIWRPASLRCATCAAWD